MLGLTGTSTFTLNGYGAIAVLVAIIGFAAGMVAYFRRSLGEATIKGMESLNATLTQRMELSETANREKDAQIRALSARVEVLQETVTQVKSIEKLNEDQAERDRLETIDRHKLHEEQKDMMNAGFDRIVVALGQVAACPFVDAPAPVLTRMRRAARTVAPARKPKPKPV